MHRKIFCQLKRKVSLKRKTPQFWKMERWKLNCRGVWASFYAGNTTFERFTFDPKAKSNR